MPHHSIIGQASSGPASRKTTEAQGSTKKHKKAQRSKNEKQKREAKTRSKRIQATQQTTGSQTTTSVHYEHILSNQEYVHA
jgi:hypothetical protein